jgi:GT2 family glycosyltransferase
MEQSKTIELSVIIVSYNVEHFLYLCLESVYAAIKNIRAEVIVIDNASVDKSVNMVRKQFPSTRVIASVDNLGFGKANNQAAKLAKGRYLCILNPDIVVSHNTFEQFIALHESIPNLGISGPQLTDGAGQFLLESKRDLPTIQAAVFKSLGLFKLSLPFFGQYYNLRLPQNQSGKTDVLVGAFMFLRKRLYDQLDGFDENFFMYGEDIDISHHSLKLGLTNFYLSEAKVIHFKGESTPKNKAYEKRFFNAMSYYYNKNFSHNWLLNSVFLLGSYVFSKFKRIMSSRRDETKPVLVNEWILLSTNPSLFKTVQANMFPSIKQCQNIIEVLQVETKGLTGIVFDMRSIQWNEVISFMQLHQTQYIYKFISADNKRIIGSSDVLSRGSGATIKKSKNKSGVSIV